VNAMLAGDAFGEAVRTDEYEAQQFSIRGVPFFAIDRKYGISGAQSADHFLEALNQAWKERPVMEPADGAVCEPGQADCLPGQ
jgi:predicted DsbA family dithiol-disulfide isomerase